MKLSASWLRHGALNTLEHALTRGADAATSLLLLWALSPEAFSKIAVAQACVAPLLFLFISPETVLYRDYGRWKAASSEELRARLRAFRIFGWAKGVAALFSSLAIASFYAGESPWSVRFFALIWAFAIVLAPQVSGPDREFLRLELRLPELNLVSLLQKSSLLAGVVASAVFFRDNLESLALAAVFSLLVTAWVSYRLVARSFVTATVEPAESVGPSAPAPQLTVIEVLRESFASFSIWSHIIGVILGWVQTMDLFFLGIFGFPARGLGLYSAALKLANFSMALPTALGNLFSVWLGRIVPQKNSESRDGAVDPELARVTWTSWAMLVILALQGGVLYLLAPWVFRILSHGRWTPEEQEMLRSWFSWILSGSLLQAAAYIFYCWLLLRTSTRELLAKVFLPWGIVSIALYVAVIRIGGFDRGFHYAAMANIGVSSVYAALILRQVVVKARA